MTTKSLLADILLEQRKPQEAEEPARQAFNDQLRVLGTQHRDTLDSLWILGKVLVQTGRYEDAKKLYLETIEKLRSGKGDVAHELYNLACLAARAGRRYDAFEYLDHAVEAGYSNMQFMRTDDDLKSLRNDPRFDQLVVRAKVDSPHPAIASN